jgi:hypothetical protein
MSMKVPAKESTTPDVLIREAFTLILFCPLSARAKEWVDENVQSDAQWFGDALCVEPRYAFGLAEGMRAEGLVLG